MRVGNADLRFLLSAYKEIVQQRPGAEERNRVFKKKTLFPFTFCTFFLYEPLIKVYPKFKIDASSRSKGNRKVEQLIISDYGTYLGKRSERVSVRYRDKDREKEEHALMDLDQIVITSRGVSMSSDLIEACTERGIEIAFLSFNGKPYAKLNSPSLTATVISRREQLAAYYDERGLRDRQTVRCGQVEEPD